MSIRGVYLWHEHVIARAMRKSCSNTEPPAALAGDTAALQGAPPAYAIRGRTSVDMITCGGYRLSGLELENVLLGHPGVAEAAVLGTPHEQLGEQVRLQGSGVPSEDSG
jgi:acyl-coenzyme A synthetase/AMP-(fatty) acid ligase